MSTDDKGVVEENFAFDRHTNLYTDRGVMKCEIYSRKCSSKNCVVKWDGAEDSVFCLSNETCVGYEIGYLILFFLF